MKIVGIEAHVLEVPLAEPYWGSQAWGKKSDGEDADCEASWQGFPPPARVRPAYAEGICTVVVKVVTDGGLVGWGEAKAPVAPRVAKTVIDDLLADCVVGQDPRNVVRLWEEMYSTMRLRGHSHGFLLEAMSGIDLALWDLLGKSLSAPVYRLLGGAFRQKVPVYASAVRGLPVAAPADAWLGIQEQARGFVERGFAAMKMAGGHGVEGDVASARAIREAVGETVELYVDAAEAYSVPQAVALARRLEPIGIGFLEAPLRAEDLDGYAELAGKTSLRIASDLLFNRYETLEFMKRRGLGLVQPDVCRAGGITECFRIAQIADAFGVAFQPHVSLGSALHFAASLHLAAAVPNLFRMEFWAGENPLGESMLRGPLLELRAGCVAVPEGPGLGIDVDEDRLLGNAI